MKLIPTTSQTVGPFFSIGLAPLCQNALSLNTAGAIAIRGTIFDGNHSPIPDAVVEFWRAGEFARVATSDDGAYSVIVNPMSGQSDKSAAKHFEVLIFMRGLLKPVYTRVYFAGAEELKYDPALKGVPAERIATLAARPTKLANEYEWNIFMQGENETVFLEY